MPATASPRWTRSQQALAETPGVAAVTPAFPNKPDAPEAYLINLVPTTAPQDAATTELVKTLRDDVIPAAIAGTALDVKVTGTAAANIDFTDFLARRTFVFFGAVLALSFLLLMVVFRSLLVPLKAVVMNVLSIGAAYGVLVAIFQWGWGADLIGIDSGPIEAMLPLMLFAIVFGLSMDYEVFLLSRVREEYDKTGDSAGAVADGLAATARVITAAAAIMVVVFGSFVLEDDRTSKLFGLGLALAVLLDATVVRMLLVPATMELLGDKNWWMPAWLDRIIPKLNVEGSDPRRRSRRRRRRARTGPRARVGRRLRPATRPTLVSLSEETSSLRQEHAVSVSSDLGVAGHPLCSRDPSFRTRIRSPPRRTNPSTRPERFRRATLPGRSVARMSRGRVAPPDPTPSTRLGSRPTRECRWDRRTGTCRSRKIPDLQHCPPVGHLEVERRSADIKSPEES